MKDKIYEAYESVITEKKKPVETKSKAKQTDILDNLLSSVARLAPPEDDNSPAAMAVDAEIRKFSPDMADWLAWDNKDYYFDAKLSYIPDLLKAQAILLAKYHKIKAK